MAVKDDYEAQIKQEFVDSANDELNKMDDILDEIREGHGDGGQAMAEIRRMAHSLKGRGGLFDFPMITVIAHRLEDYLANLDAITPDICDDAQIFVDRMHDVIEGRLEGNGASVVRELPAKMGSGFDPSGVTKIDVEVMLIAPRGTATQIVERELQACGYRVTNVSSPFTALELIVRTRPDLVIAQAVMPDLNGLDMAIALTHMPSTKSVPFALLTSYDRDHESLKGLPKKVPVIRKGGHFGDDLANALSDLKIT